MTAPGLRQLRDVAERRTGTARADAVEAVDAIFHSWCGRPHESCPCVGNPRAGVERPLPPMGARLQASLMRGRAA